MMQILLLGKYGQLGWELHRSLGTLGEVAAFDFPDIDLSHPEGIRQVVQQVKPDVIINATAYTAVDRAESESETAHTINAVAPGIMAEVAFAHDTALIHFSTDYVFDGAQNRPYLETDSPNPLSVYGQSKLDGERAIQQIGGAYLILRTSWVYSLRRDSFVTKVLSWSRQQKTLRVVADQVSNPTWARMLAEATAQLLAKAGTRPARWVSQYSGLYHLAGFGYASRLDWAKAILDADSRPAEQLTQEILPAQTADFPTPARRPLFSALNCQRFMDTFNLRLPDWQEALTLAMAEIQSTP
jgi:dTDP-4-dehydrorhamnose reductase